MAAGYTGSPVRSRNQECNLAEFAGVGRLGEWLGRRRVREEAREGGGVIEV